VFNAVELRLIDNDYFDIVRADPYIEVKSRNTLHYWIIKKVRTIKGGHIILHHKHPKQRYYHKHDKVRTVEEAVNLILRHDQYIIRKSPGN